MADGPGQTGVRSSTYEYVVELGMGRDFFNRRYSLLSFGGPQEYNLKALPFIYHQYVVLDLADKLYNSVPVCLFLLYESMSFT